MQNRVFKYILECLALIIALCQNYKRPFKKMVALQGKFNHAFGNIVKWQSFEEITQHLMGNLNAKIFVMPLHV